MNEVEWVDFAKIVVGLVGTAVLLMINANLKGILKQLRAVKPEAPKVLQSCTEEEAKKAYDTGPNGPPAESVQFKFGKSDLKM